VALLEKAAAQGHAYAMQTLGSIYDERKEYEEAVAWFTMAAEAGLPRSKFTVGVFLDAGIGVAAPDHAAGAYTRSDFSST
jgi:TPR repeat protein